MTTATPYQLPDGDAIFLSMETPNALAHIGSLSVLDPSTNPDFGFDALAERIGERLTLVPRFTWKLQQVPLSLDRPYWVPDPDFRVRDHVRRAALPAPGSLRELTELAGHLHAQPLDRSRPMWEATLIEGLADGRVAVYLKVHHCLMDGTSGNGLAEVLADLTPDAAAPPLVPEAYDEDTPVEPTAFEVARSTFANALRRGGKRGEHLRRGLTDLWRSRRDEDPDAIQEVPRLPFNGNPGRRRAVAVASLPLEPVKALRKHFDVKLNDVMLEIAGSAVRRYLKERDELPEAPIVAMCPVSTRSADDIKLENQITSMAVPLATDEPDPVQRLRRIARSALRAKEGVKADSFDWLAAVGESVAPAVVNLFMKASELGGDQAPLPANFTFSNVRGTPIPLYLAGARVESLMPISVLAPGQGLNITVFSYLDRIDVGITYDPELVPDAETIAGGMASALEELEAAAEGVVHLAR